MLQRDQSINSNLSTQAPSERAPLLYKRINLVNTNQGKEEICSEGKQISCRTCFISRLTSLNPNTAEESINSNLSTQAQARPFCPYTGSGQLATICKSNHSSSHFLIITLAIQLFSKERKVIFNIYRLRPNLSCHISDNHQ